MFISVERKKELQVFTKTLNVNIKDFKSLDMALTHGSYLKEKNLSLQGNNERLEFFGDAVLKLFISEYLMEHYPSFSEGRLSKLRAFVVSERVLIEVANKTGLKKHIQLGKNEKKTFPKSILADTFEALLAVIYYDCGVHEVRKFIIKYFADIIKSADSEQDIENYKAILQEYTQEKKLGLPLYKTVLESGPDHKKIFEVEVCLNNKKLASGKGDSKKEASQSAAKNALLIINSKSNN